jgi:iron complex transport system ATP-binding protein
MLHVHHIHASYDRPILHDVSFGVRAGTCCGIIGPNASGKSTLMRIASGLERPKFGFVTLSGIDVHSMDAKKRAQSIAIVGQDALPPHALTVRDVVAMGRTPHRTWRGGEQRPLFDPLFGCTDHAQFVEHIIHYVQLSANDRLSTLSGGHRQRVALAQAIAQQPRLLFLDEPTTHLDLGSQQRWMELLQKWIKKTHIAVVVVLHDLNLAALYCDELILMHGGRIVMHDTPERVLTSATLRTVFDHATLHPITHPQNASYRQLLFCTPSSPNF